MIEAFSLKTAHQFGDALASQARLRYRVFVAHRGLPHASYDGMEYDEFDTPAAVYLVWRDADGIVRGLIRMLPTSVPYMLEQYWPYLCTTRDLPKSDDIWEATRMCVDRSFDARIRPRIFPELLCGAYEFCLQNNIRAVVGVTRLHLITHFLRTGIQPLGAPAEIEGQQEAAVWAPADCLRPVVHCERFRTASIRVVVRADFRSTGCRMMPHSQSERRTATNLSHFGTTAYHMADAVDFLIRVAKGADMKNIAARLARIRTEPWSWSTMTLDDRSSIDEA